MAAADFASVAPANGSRAAPANAAPAAGPAPARTAQGQPPIIEPPAAARPEACDDSCVRRAADFAAQSCVPLIEAKAMADYDWLSRPFVGMFTQAEKPGADGVIRFRGDSIRILTQNQWLRFAYECAFDPVQRKIVSVQVRPGVSFRPRRSRKRRAPRWGSQPANKLRSARLRTARKPANRNQQQQSLARISASRARFRSPKPICAAGKSTRSPGFIKFRSAARRASLAGRSRPYKALTPATINQLR